MPSILIVEDELNLAEGLKFNLEAEGYRVSIRDTAERAFEIYNEFDLVVLDIMLPGISGIELLKRIRQTDYKHPILLLSAKAAEEDLIEGLEAGADDYVTKPFSLPELLLRIKRILERQAWVSKDQKLPSTFQFGNFTVNFETLEADTVSGPKPLTAYECNLLKCLIENRHRGVTREELLQKVWGYDQTPETRTVDIFIARLRKMFEEDSKQPQHIKSIRGVGYRFFE